MDQVSRKLGKVSLERALSKLGIASRSQTQALIADGKITVNGKVIRDPFFKVIPENDDIIVGGVKAGKVKPVTIMLHKPRGYVTTRSDEKGRKTVYDLLPQELRHLHPVGRLDMASSGLLLLTTDTQFSNHLTDPSYAIERTYTVTVDGLVTPEKLGHLEQGVMHEGEFLKPLRVVVRKKSRRESHVTITLTEGKNREIRRMMEVIGLEVTQLKRVSFGTFELGELPIGMYQEIRVSM